MILATQKTIMILPRIRVLVAALALVLLCLWLLSDSFEDPVSYIRGARFKKSISSTRQSERERTTGPTTITTIITITAAANITITSLKEVQKPKEQTSSKRVIKKKRRKYRRRYHMREIALPKIAIINPGYSSIKSHMKILATRVIPKVVRPRTCDNCNNFNFTSTLEPDDLCADEDPIDLLVLITTIPNAIVARQALRETWLQHSNDNTANIRHIFLFGAGWSEKEQEIIKNESLEFGDILQEDYKDSYYNLSLKMMSGFKWAHRNCKHAYFTLRTADDNYINIPQIINWIRTNGPKNLYAQIGHAAPDLSVLRTKVRKWYISPIEFPENKYPPYAVGTAFLYSMTAIEHIIRIAPNVPYFCIEDAWFGMVMRELKMPVINEPAFDRLLENRLLDQMMRETCPNEGNFLSLHLVSPEAMVKLWKQCPSTGLDKRHSMSCKMC